MVCQVLCGLDPRTLARGNEGMKKGQAHRHTYSEAGVRLGSATCSPAPWTLSMFIRYSTGRG